MIIFNEETEKLKHDAVIFGIPKLRYIVASRNSVGGVSEAEKLMPQILDALVRPLTADEKATGGKWAPTQPRILFEGTLEDAEEFYHQDIQIPRLMGAPFSKYTDGLPIVVPTEERVEKMLKGTSHKPDELITVQADSKTSGAGGPFAAVGEADVSRHKGDLVSFMPMYRSATVEQVAVNAVMAGCTPDQFPVVLAMAEAGGGTGDGRGGGGAWLVSGPIYKEIGMNVTNFIFGPGNRVNKALGRVGSIMWRNLGGYEETISTITTMGSPITNGGFIYAEYAEGLPKGWLGLNEELGYRKDESVLMAAMAGSWGLGQQHMPGVYRSLQRTGHGAIARFLNVKGIPGPHNYLEYLVKDIWATHEGGFTLVLPEQVAQDLYDYGFKSKQSIYEWFWKQSFEPVAKYRMRGMGDFTTNGWLAIERTSGKPWRDLPDDYMVPVAGNDPMRSFNIVVIHMEETAPARYGGGKGQAYSIDAWR